jgi:hypothetical protein
MKSFRRKDGQDEPLAPGRNGERNFRGEKRSNETHASTTEPDARLTLATGTAEPQAAVDRLGALPGAQRKTVGADKNYDTAALVAAARAMNATPHVAQNITAYRGSTIDGWTTRHTGYRISQVIRKRIEEANGWIKEVGGMAQTKFRSLARVGWMFTLKAAAYNLIRLPRLLATG